METTNNKQVQFKWESANRPDLVVLKEKLNLENVEDFLELKDLVHKSLPFGNNPKIDASSDAITMLDAAVDGGEFYCSHYSKFLMDAATAIGMKARKIIIDTKHGLNDEEMHHSIDEIWSPKHKKWVVVDAMGDIHFEKDGIPLSALEVRTEYLKNGARDIEGVIGKNKERIKYNGTEKGFHTPSNYFWIGVYTDNGKNMLSSPVLLFVDEFNKNDKWYRGGVNKGEPSEHPMYQGQFVRVEDKKVIYPEIK